MKITPKAIGKMACLCCGEQITVKQADTGTVSVSCPDCDFSGYGKAGTDAHRKIMERVTFRKLDAMPPVTLPPVATKGPIKDANPPKPATKMADLPAVRRNTVFG